VLYRDRQIPLAPLTYELMARLLGWFGSSLWVGRILAALVFGLCVVAVHRILLRLCGPRAALLGALGLFPLKALAFPLWTIANYSQLGMLFSLLCVLGLLRSLEGDRVADLLAAGLAAGLTLLTKQNLGGILCLVAGLTVLADSLAGEARLRGLVRSAGWLGLGAGLPVGLALALYAAQGALGPLLEQAVFGAARLGSLYPISFPSLALWSLQPEVLARHIFSYFPPVLVVLSWDRVLDLGSAWTALPIELLVKSAYLVPLLAVAALLARILYRARSAGMNGRVSRRLLVVAFAAGFYASMLYRADWAHLMNIFPAALVAIAVWLAEPDGSPRWRKPVATGLTALWMAWGATATLGVFTAYRTPVETPRGRLLGAKLQASEVASVLRYLGGQPREQHLAVLRAEPLYYFLSGRPIPLPLDLFMPGVVTPEIDRQSARTLEELDQVIYNPQESPLVPRPVTAYAPRTAAVLALRFRVDRVLGATACVLRPYPDRPPPSATRRDLLPSLLSEQRPMGVGSQETWAVYRVLPLSLQSGAAPVCLTTEHRVEAGDALWSLPIFPPSEWASFGRENPDARALFSIQVAAAGAAPRTLWREARTSGPPGEPLQLDLADSAGKTVELMLCARGSHASRAGFRVGWAEPRIVVRGTAAEGRNPLTLRPVP